MNPQIAAMIDGIIGREGAYVDHPSDPGGATIWGMTERVARANGYTDDMRVMPQAVARDIYYREYIVKPGFLSIAEIDPAVAEEVLDRRLSGPAPQARRFRRAPPDAEGAQRPAVHALLRAG